MREITTTTEAEWDGPVFVDVAGAPFEGFFRDCGELREWLEEDGVPMPADVYPCEARGVKLNAGWIIEGACDDHAECVMEDAEDHQQELQVLLDQWCATLKARSWDPMYNHRVIMNAETVEPEPEEYGAGWMGLHPHEEP